jgi:hypothetical protein
MEKRRNTHRFSIKKPEGKRPFGKPSGRWEDNKKLRQSRYRPGVAHRVLGS